MKRTPLFEEHKKLGARFVPFAGWEMPVQYRGVGEEHQCVRNHVGLFDVSHMGEIFVSGARAFETVQWLLTNDASRLVPGKAQYSILANTAGGAVDDVILYQLREQEYLVCVNASNREKDFQWMLEQNRFGAEIRDVSDDFVQIAVQGPKAAALVKKVTGVETETTLFPAFHHRPMTTPTEGILARTGYTGEDGFEIYCRADQGPALWQQLLSDGAEFGVQPIGLGARDTLRLEAALCLYGHELREEWDVLSAGLGWVVKFAKGEFLGREALLALQEPKRKLVGLELLDPGIAREETPVFSPTGEELGIVTSGTRTPTVGKSICLAYIPRERAVVGEEVVCEVRGKRLRARICALPFYRRGHGN